MYVKSLTLRGFKSFASATTLRLEPGITCIVGPNGSGKSNVVDALAWVMGEQGAKSLRGGKMEDVIFAGTAGRAPLGRAEVALTIDNTDGALPIDYTEVTIARTMFRNGGSEYAINGTSCRLLDVQELLSDSGIGREMHVIVGQGQLDTVLRATPEERRGFIEEAAGVLKHRKRKERALRKLETMEANLTRVNDLTGEIRRQLGPLGRQAEAARKAAVIQADARDARLRLLADDLVQLTATLEQEVADETALIARRTEVEEGLAGRPRPPRRARAGGPGGGARAGPGPGALVRPAVPARPADLHRVPGRRAGAPALPGRRRRRRPPGATPRSCAEQAAQARQQEEALLAEIAEAKDELQRRRRPHRAAAERALHRRAAAAARLVRAAADRREGLAKLAGQVGARRSRIEAGEAEIGRLRGSRGAALARAADRRAGVRRPRGLRRGRRGGRGGAGLRLRVGRRRARAGSRPRSSAWREAGARRRARPHQRRGPARGPRAQPAAARTAPPRCWPPADSRHGIVGSVAALLQVAGGHEAAIAAALGWAGRRGRRSSPSSTPPAP